MKSKAQFGSFALGLAALSTLWLWLGGCDFNRLDEGSKTPLESHLRAITDARSEAQAEKAIRLLLSKLEVGAEWKTSKKPGLYDFYVFNDEDVKATARAQARYNGGTSPAGATIRSVYEEVRAANESARRIQSVFDYKPRVVSASVEEVANSFLIFARHALAEPERPNNALVLSIASRGASLYEPTTRFSPETPLSPFQRLLFLVWLHRNGPSLPLYLEEGAGKTASNSSCPVGTHLVAKFNFSGGSYVFEKPEGNENVVEITNGSASSGDWTSSEDISVIILKGSTDTDVITLDPEATSGSFDNGNLYTSSNQQADISNVQFCAGGTSTPPSCQDCCYAGYTTCISAAPCSCEGKITSLTLEYTGSAPNPEIQVDIVSPHGVTGVLEVTLAITGDPTSRQFTVIGPAERGPSAFDGTLGNELALYVDDNINAQIHTSCSDPAVIPGYVAGDFRVIELESKEGGTCSTDPTCGTRLQACLNDCHDQGGSASGTSCSF